LTEWIKRLQYIDFLVSKKNNIHLTWRIG